MTTTSNNVVSDVPAASASIPEGISSRQVQFPSKSNNEANAPVVNSLCYVDEYSAPTEEEKTTLRLVPASLPLVSYAICIVELAERASYYGAKTVYSNFIEFPLPKGGSGTGAPPRHTQETAGALGLGLQASSGLVLLFTFLAYVIPIFGGWLGDVKTGRYKAIIYGVAICGIAHIVQVIGAIPYILQMGPAHATPPFIIGLLLLAVGAGIFKPNVAPILLDQHRYQKQYIKVLTTGERVIVDPEMTSTHTMLIFYGFINVGAFFMLATTYSEKYVGFWLSFLEVGAIYFLLPVVLALIYSRTYKTPPSGNDELKQACRIIGTALRQNKFQVWRRGFWDAAMPSVLKERGINVDWSEKLVDDIRRTVSACEVFCYFPIWYLNDGGFGSVRPNHLAITETLLNENTGRHKPGGFHDYQRRSQRCLEQFNALTIIVSVPLLSYGLYPTLARFKIKFGRITRITFGFFLATVSGVIGAIVQWRVYRTSPCGHYASSCDVVSPLSIWWQVPNQVLGALSECFANVTAYELAYARSPPSMRGLIMAIFLFMNALSSALGEILIPATKDPWLIWIWAAPAVALAVQSLVFWFRFRHINDDEYLTDEKGDESTESTSIQNFPKQE